MKLAESARLRLTATYLLIIMTMSISFSVAFYNTSDQELGRARRIPVPDRIEQPLMQEFESLRQLRLEQGRDNLQQRLIGINLITFAVGALLSYFLARRTLQPIEESMAAQAQFTSDASHELRTPLTAMRSEIEVALRDAKLSPDDARITLQSNLEEIEKLEALTGGLLQLASQENIGETTSRVRLQSLIDDSVHDVAAPAKKRSISIKSPAKITHTVHVEPSSIRQAIVILLDNAIKYSPVKSTVELSANLQKHELTIIVTDHGPGIAADDLPHIFDRFYRSDKARQSDGYGLGLAIAQQIVQRHGGQIHITSPASGGTSAIMTIPQK